MKLRKLFQSETPAILLTCFMLIIGCVFLTGALKHKLSNHPQSRTVMLRGLHTLCSGAQVRAKSGVDYILSAGHCMPAVIDGMVEIITEDGKVLERKVIAEDKNSDLMLLEGAPGMKGLDIADYTYRGQHIRTYTHGRGMATYKTEGVLIETMHIAIPAFEITNDQLAVQCRSMPKYQEITVGSVFGEPMAVCVLSLDEYASTAFILPGSSGGMVVDDSGKLAAIVSASGEGIGYFVSLKDIHHFVDNY